MRKESTQLLHLPISQSFRGLDHDSKLKTLQVGNISLISDGLENGLIVQYVEEARKLGFTPVMLGDVFTALAFDVSHGKIDLPRGRKQKKELGRLITDMLNNMDFEFTQDDCHMRITAKSEQGEIDLLKAYSSLEDTSVTDQIKLSISRDPMIFGQVLGRLKELVSGKNGLVVTENSFNQILPDGTRILVASASARRDQVASADRILSTTDPGAIKFGVLRENVHQAQYRVRRKELQDAIDNGQISLTPKFSLDDWPHDPFMQRLREEVSLLVPEYIKSTRLLCDSHDLKYQTLFRLTTFDVSDVFQDGRVLDRYLWSIGAYNNWRNILRVNPEVINKFAVNPDLVKQVIEEQAVIISDRLRRSGLPVEDLLATSGIFGDPGWVIQKRDSEIYAVVEEGFTAVGQQVLLDFREIDPKLAMSFHRDLHYIHTPRATLAFGLFIRGEDIPFSVLALDKIDRSYKQNVLLIQGYDPRKCFDLTRLWSKPGTPGNTSSSMFSLTFKHLREHYPQVQAVFSAFMPSYATGVSMTSGGFNNPVIIKPLTHVFIERQIGGKTVYEHITRRRQVSENGRTIKSKFPLLPTIELMASLQLPRYKPLIGTTDLMVEIH